MEEQKQKMGSVLILLKRPSLFITKITKVFTIYEYNLFSLQQVIFLSKYKV
jgi:hypothetical protein